MEVSTARFVAVGIAAIGFVVWFIAFLLLKRASQWKRPVDALGESKEVVSDDHYSNSVIVQGEASELLAKASALIARDSLSDFGAMKIVNQTPDSLELEKVPTAMTRSVLARAFSRAKLQFTSMGGGQSQIDYAIELRPLRWMLIVGWVIQSLGFLALTVGCWALITFVATSPNPATRWQAIQMVQAVHFLWPPFFFAVVYSRGRKGTIGQFDAFVHNLPYAKV